MVSIFNRFYICDMAELGVGMGNEWLFFKNDLLESFLLGNVKEI